MFIFSWGPYGWNLLSFAWLWPPLNCTPLWVPVLVRLKWCLKVNCKLYFLLKFCCCEVKTACYVPGADHAQDDFVTLTCVWGKSLACLTTWWCNLDSDVKTKSWIVIVPDCFHAPFSSHRPFSVYMVEMLSIVGYKWKKSLVRVLERLANIRLFSMEVRMKVVLLF